MQMIFQDPFASLNPRMRVGEIVAEPLAIHEPQLTQARRLARAGEILRRVGLDETALQRYPHEFPAGSVSELASCAP
jgi:ABC-type microcin C transport system duplicated ATPase subunit YejF